MYFHFYWIRNLFLSFQTSKVLPLSVQPMPPGSCFCLWLSPVIPVSNSISVLRAVKSLQKAPGPRAGPLIQITNRAQQLHSFCDISATIFTVIQNMLTKFFTREFQPYSSWKGYANIMKFPFFPNLKKANNFWTSHELKKFTRMF